MNRTPVEHQAKIRRGMLAFCVAGAAILAAVYVAALAMKHGPQNPPPITSGFFKLNMPSPPQHGLPTGKQISASVRVIFQGSPGGVPAAEQRLITAGDAALPAIRHALTGLTRPAIRRRLRFVLAAIARADALRGPLITLKLKKATLQKVFIKLCVPVGIQPDFYPMMHSGAPPPSYFRHIFLTVNVQHQPFWQVMRAIAQLTGVSPTADGFFGPELHIGAQPPMRPGVFGTPMPVDIQGAFVITLQWPWRNSLPAGPTVLPAARPAGMMHRAGRQEVPGRGPAARRLLLLVNVLWCPDENRLITFGPLQITQVLDNTGRSLLVPARPDAPWRANWNNFWSSSGQMMVFTCQAWLKQPAPRARFLSVMRGHVPVQLCFDRREYQIKHLSSGKACLHWHGLKVRFRRPVMASPTSGPTHLAQWRVRLFIDPGAASRRWRLQAGQLGQQLQEMEAVKFFSADGRCLAACQMGSYAWGNWKGSYKYTITGGRPVRARITLYRQTQVKLDVPFVLKNVPLPRPG